MDKSLDEIISSKPKTRRGANRRGGARAIEQVLGKPVVTPAQRNRAAATVADNTKPVSQVSDKIIVSNLPADVNEAQIRDLFTQTVGALKDIALHYDAAGRSMGMASVTFQKKGDGNKAHQQYNNRLIDGKRPMKVEIVYNPSNPAARPLTSRVAPAPAANGVKAQAPRAAGTRGRRQPKGRTGTRKSERPPKTAADLDAEMEDYTAGNAPTAAA